MQAEQEPEPEPKPKSEPKAKPNLSCLNGRMPTVGCQRLDAGVAIKFSFNGRSVCFIIISEIETVWARSDFSSA